MEIEYDMENSSLCEYQTYAFICNCDSCVSHASESCDEQLIRELIDTKLNLAINMNAQTKFAVIQ